VERRQERAGQRSDVCYDTTLLPPQREGFIVERWSAQSRFWGGVAVLNVMAYLSLAYLVKVNGPFPLDHQVRHLFQRFRGDQIGWLMRGLEAFGDWQLLGLVLLTLTPFLSREVRKEFLLFFLIALTGGGALGQLSKIVVGRVRPGDPRFGFPSGHAIAAVVVISGLLYFCSRRGVFQKPLSWIGAVGGGGFVVLGVGASRIYTDSHWLTDVLGGILLGVATVTTVALTFQLKPKDKGQSKP
jgi:undecaprenyl-diphosphatase